MSEQTDVMVIAFLCWYFSFGNYMQLCMCIVISQTLNCMNFFFLLAVNRLTLWSKLEMSFTGFFPPYFTINIILIICVNRCWQYYLFIIWICYTPVEATFSMSILCFNRHGQYFNSWSVACPDLSDPSSLTECTSDNQRLGTSNDTTSVAKHPTLKRQLNWGTDYSLSFF